MPHLRLKRSFHVPLRCLTCDALGLLFHPPNAAHAGEGVAAHLRLEDASEAGFLATAPEHQNILSRKGGEKKGGGRESNAASKHPLWGGGGEGQHQGVFNPQSSDVEHSAAGSHKLDGHETLPRTGKPDACDTLSSDVSIPKQDAVSFKTLPTSQKGITIIEPYAGVFGCKGGRSLKPSAKPQSPDHTTGLNLRP